MNTKFICRLLILSILIIFPIELAIGQLIKDKADDIFTEMDADQLTLRFFNALNGEPITGAVVGIEGIGSYSSDHEGKVLFPAPEEDGFYTVRFSKNGFIESVFNIEIQVGSLFFNRFSISPDMPLGTIRVALDWDKKPRDLDAHMRKLGSFHISYRNKKVAEDGKAKLDRDDTNGYGPETITISKVDEQATYYYYVHNYSNRNKSSDKNLSKSKASVKLYGGNNQLLQVFQAPQKVKGTYWHVFTINNGEIIPVNKVVKTEPGS
ncbi:MAG: hypothetical protein J7K40_12885 [candidate division Zixibacteria bacterium]|nr:hypothetical protein [candidate division Zixibacteria bacterium]